MVDTEIKKEGKKIVVTIGGQLINENAEKIKEVLIKAISKGNHILVRFGKVEAVDFSFFQLMCASHRSSEAKNKVFSMDDKAPETIANVARILGLYRQLSCPIAKMTHCFWMKGEKGEPLHAH